MRDLLKECFANPAFLWVVCSVVYTSLRLFGDDRAREEHEENTHIKQSDVRQMLPRCVHCCEQLPDAARFCTVCGCSVVPHAVTGATQRLQGNERDIVGFLIGEPVYQSQLTDDILCDIRFSVLTEPFAALIDRDPE